MKLTSLKDIKPISNSHNPKVFKKVLITNGQIPNLTNFTQAVFPPGEIASEHSHSDMYEVFFIEEGQAQIKINGQVYPLSKGDCLTAEPGDSHEVSNPSDQEVIITYFGIEIS